MAARPAGSWVVASSFFCVQRAGWMRPRAMVPRCVVPWMSVKVSWSSGESAARLEYQIQLCRRFPGRRSPSSVGMV